MSNLPTEKRLKEERLRHVLTTLILIADGYRWPGADGLMIEDVLREYPAIARQGHVPGREELCLRHPELASEVADFFACFRSIV